MRASDQYLQRLQTDSAAAVAAYELREETYWNNGSGARWRLGRPQPYGYASEYACEIIAADFGTLIVHGDVEWVRFARYGGGGAWRRLCWIADSTDLDYYVAQKACIGSGREVVYQYNEAVARAELTEAAARWEQDGEHGQRAIRVVREAVQRAETETELRDFLAREEPELWEYQFGRVLQPRVVFAHAALQKCAALLREKYGGPPDCRT